MVSKRVQHDRVLIKHSPEERHPELVTERSRSVVTGSHDLERKAKNTQSSSA